MKSNILVRCLKTVLLATAVLPASVVLAQGKGKSAPQFINSLEDSNWRLQQAAARPWTREEMLSAKPADERGVNDDTLRMWAEQAATAQYDVKGGPGFSPSGAPVGARVPKAATLAADPQAAGISPTGYSYPAPYTRYESFPYTATSYNVFPYYTVGKVFFTIPGEGNFVCSASSIGGDAVITAGHCVHSGNTADGFHTNWVFVPGYRNGVSPYGQWSADHLWIRGGYINNDDGDFRYDIGGAVLTRKSGQKISQKVGFLGFAWNQSTTGTSAHFALLGYPQAAPFNGDKQFVCQSSFAYTATGSAPNPIGVGCDQTGGTSGGPWIRNFSGATGSTNYVNGVNSYRRCYNLSCTSLYTQELFSPYFDTKAKSFKDCLVNSVPGNPANPDSPFFCSFGS